MRGLIHAVPATKVGVQHESQHAM